MVARHDGAEYPFRLSLYTQLPTHTLSLSDFETFALDRLKVLRAIENAAVRNKSADDMAATVKAATDKYLRMDPNMARTMVGNAALDEQRRKDHLSHFILKLAFCRTEDNRAWFVNHETLLFKYRFESEYSMDREDFLRNQQLNFVPITRAEFSAFERDFRSLYVNNYDQKYFKVPFENVLQLVARRAVIIKAGFAFVPEIEQATLVTNAFKKQLSASLESFARSLPRMDEDDRLIPVLNSIARQCASRDYSLNPSDANSTAIQAGEVDALASQGHFPLCMTNLHMHLKADAHLKHSGRLQFGLFLKGIGVPLEEALIYWRKAFNKLTDDKFNKEYAYNVRFNYGQEGSRKDYAPYSCSKIIMSNPPAAGDHHGCPFRHVPPDALRAMVVKSGASEGVAVDVMRLAKDGHYQIACTRLFEAEGIVDVIEHPNQWFDLSYRGLDSGKHRGARKEDGNSMDVDR
ncbi:DNA primase large subunit Spp2 [Chytriomyces sp. MP71]|nr:DNA primase large subunit Spp2 [Chytriomyces sp. MP71]